MATPLDLTHWCLFLCAVSAVNIAAWGASAVTLGRRQSRLAGEVRNTRRLLLALSAVYVLGCAFRSLVPVYDIPRLTLADSTLATVLIGRSVATLAELAFIAQCALLLNEFARTTDGLLARRAALIAVPLIALAECFSWYSVLTTSNFGHMIEESLWGIAVALLVAGLLAILPRTARHQRPLLLFAATVGGAYVAFMFLVDVPMYASRWLTDEAAGRSYLSILEGLSDVAGQATLSLHWHHWQHEIAWMSLYFSVAVWFSIALVHAPSLQRVPHPSPQRSRPWHLLVGSRVAGQ